MTQLVAGQREVGAGITDQRFTQELHTSVPLRLFTMLAHSAIASGEAFTAANIPYRFAHTSVSSAEAFDAALRVFPKGATGTHPTTNDSRTTVTGPADLSGKNFTNPVTITGSSVTGTQVSFAKKPTFQDCSVDLRNVWFDQNGASGLCDILGTTSTTSVTIRGFTANQYQGDSINIDGTHIGTITLYNGIVRPAAASAGSSIVIGHSSLASTEAFTAGTVKGLFRLAASSLATSEAFTAGSVGVGGSLGAAVPITPALIGDQIYHNGVAGTLNSLGNDGDPLWGDSDHTPGRDLWFAERWVDLYLDQPPFGRQDKTQPPSTNIYAGSVTIGATGIPSGSAGTVPATSYTVTTSGSVKTVTLNLQCWSLTVDPGDTADPHNLVVKGKVWCVDPNADATATLAAFNATWDSTVGGTGLFSINNCTPALTNVYVFGGNPNPAIRFNNTLVLDANTPSIDGGFFYAFSHDGIKLGSGAQVWLRHCSWRPHPYVAAYTTPNQKAIPPLPLFVDPLLLTPDRSSASPPNPPHTPTLTDPSAWNSSYTFAKYQAVQDPFGNNYYSLANGNQGNLLPGEPASSDPGLGGHNTWWQFYGNLHADLDQGFAVGATRYENCFWYQGQHVSIYLEKAYKVFLKKILDKDPPSTWDAGGNYIGFNPPTSSNKSSFVRGSNGQEFVAIANSGPLSAGPKDPTNPANSAYWTPGSAHQVTAKWCITHGNNVSISNANLDPSNGITDSVFSLDFSNPPVQGGSNNDTTDGVHVLNKRNHYAHAAAGDPLVAGSSSEASLYVDAARPLIVSASELVAMQLQGSMKADGTPTNTAASLMGAIAKGGHSTHMTGATFQLIDQNPSAGVFTYSGNVGSNRPLLSGGSSSIRPIKTSIDLVAASGAGTDKVLIAFGAEDWKHLVATGSAAVLPDPSHFQAHADAIVDALLAAAAANGGAKYFTHVSFWQEHKSRVDNGLTHATWEADATLNPDTWTPANDTTYRSFFAWAMTKAYNTIYDTLKAHANSIVNTVLVGGPHYAFGGISSDDTKHSYPLGDGASIPAWSWDYDAFVYWLKWSHGFDFVSIDYSLVDYNDTTNSTLAYIKTHAANWSTLVGRVKALQATYAFPQASGVVAVKRAAPIDAIEWYWDTGVAGGAGGKPTWVEEDQALAEAIVLHQLWTSGVRKLHKWAMMGDISGSVMKNLASWFRWTNTTSATNDSTGLFTNTGPGTKYAAYDAAKAFVDNFPSGTQLYRIQTTDPELVAIGSSAKALIINTNTTTSKTVYVQGSTITIPAKTYSVVTL